eukprot:CAMPEP_0118959290 /NCGR_PEP_ID=MMETSP1169-20130426/63057_1 /TAXON_ID=36882 /ORGANISM="Pyramimonas obovata, Strain CCMP722" /LENGTH=65 /DNA_ID=CAMNT_0006907421 /DNA_START=117 /DNA_END=314 /DNA_ORIENTATION=+
MTCGIYDLGNTLGDEDSASTSATDAELLVYESCAKAADGSRKRQLQRTWPAFEANLPAGESDLQL